MKKLHLLFAGAFAALAIVACSDDELETETTTESLVLEYTIETDGTTIQLPLGKTDAFDNKYTINCTVNWGDGTKVKKVNDSFPTHTYSAGTYTVIINGTVELLCSNSIDGKKCLTAVKQWGDTGLKSMDRAFTSCTKLSSLPDGPGPFSNVTSFFEAFAGCESLTTFPEGIFSNCTSAENFEWTFDSCINLTSAPSFKGLSNVTSFYCAFDCCVSLTTVPDDIFAGCTAVEDFGCVFNSCFSLETVPFGIFDDCRLATDFYQAFCSCGPMVGESPYTIIDGEKVHLYERENYPDYFSVPTHYICCFAFCTKLDDYDDIPSGWK